MYHATHSLHMLMNVPYSMHSSALPSRGQRCCAAIAAHLFATRPHITRERSQYYVYHIDPNNPDATECPCATESTHIDVQLNVHGVQPCLSVTLIQGSLCDTLL